MAGGFYLVKELPAFFDRQNDRVSGIIPLAYFDYENILKGLTKCDDALTNVIN